jgi:hypothetical protein
MSSTGNTSAVGLVTWSTSTRRVREESVRVMASSTWPDVRNGKGTSAVTTLAPARSATKRAALLHAA